MAAARAVMPEETLLKRARHAAADGFVAGVARAQATGDAEAVGREATKLRVRVLDACESVLTQCARDKREVEELTRALRGECAAVSGELERLRAQVQQAREARPQRDELEQLARKVNEMPTTDALAEQVNVARRELEAGEQRRQAVLADVRKYKARFAVMLESAKDLDDEVAAARARAKALPARKSSVSGGRATSSGAAPSTAPSRASIDGVDGGRAASASASASAAATAPDNVDEPDDVREDSGRSDRDQDVSRLAEAMETEAEAIIEPEPETEAEPSTSTSNE